MTTPLLSIIIPSYDDEVWIAATLDSCIAQNLESIEILCVDDASEDGTRDVIARYQERDARIRLIEQPSNLSAFQARRVGIEHAQAPYVLFLDADDELREDAARTAIDHAQATGADIIAFGVDVEVPTGMRTPAFAADIQPKHDSLSGAALISQIFPAGKPAHGHIWGYVFRTELLREAYAGLSRDVRIPRANDVPITFMAFVNATSFASTKERLYKYHFRRGTSGHRVSDTDGFRFYLGAIDSIEMIAAKVEAAAVAASNEATAILDSYESVRLSLIGTVLRYAIGADTDDLRRECLEILQARVGPAAVVRAAAGFCPQALPLLVEAQLATGIPAKTVRHVLLTTADLDTGGVQSVVASQARYLVNAGFRVTIVLKRAREVVFDLPEGVEVHWASGEHPSARVGSWLEIVSATSPDIVIDHHILYNREWPYIVLASLSLGVPTIGWLHSFSLRPLLDGNNLGTFLVTHLPLLQAVVTLSATDVAYWKLRGLDRVYHLPNPPSPALRHITDAAPKVAPNGAIRLVWWGRLQQSTKQVLSLVRLAAELRARDVDFELLIIGPDSPDLSARQVLNDAVLHRVDGYITLSGALHGHELAEAIRHSDVFVSASVIEGYSLALLEAQAHGLPSVIFDLPWLTNLAGNGGVFTVAQGDVRDMASRVIELQEPVKYEAAARAAREAAERSLQYDFAALYAGLVRQDLPKEFAPEPTLDDARMLVQWTNFYAERRFADTSDHAKLRRDAGASKRQIEALLSDAVEYRGRIRKLQRNLSAAERSLARPLVKRVLGASKRRLRSIVGITESTPDESTSRRSASTEQVSRRPSSAVDSRIDESTLDVSVVVPVYNADPWLEQCLSSVLAQPDVDLEVICVNDGSTDDSRDILERFASLDARIRIIDQPNSGQSVGRNAGIDAARGRYVVFLDSDDYWQPNLLKSLVDRADEDDLDVLQFEAFAFRDGDVSDEMWARYDRYYQRSREYTEVRRGTKMMVAQRKRGDYRVHVGMYLARVSFVRANKIRFIPGIVHQDNPYTFELLLRAERVSHQPAMLYARRLRPGSTITTLKAANSTKGYFLSYVAMLRLLVRSDLPNVEAETLSGIAQSVFEGARKQFITLPVSVGDLVKGYDASAEAQSVFRLLRSARDQLASPSRRRADAALVAESADFVSESEKLSDLVDIAASGVASQSSEESGSSELGAQAAVAGNFEQDFTIYTRVEDSPWWQLDLGAWYRLDQIRILNRDEVKFRHRASSIRIEVSDDAVDWSTVHAGRTYFGSDDETALRVQLSGELLVRYVRLSLDERAPLHLRRVRVFVRRDELIARQVLESIGLRFAERARFSHGGARPEEYHVKNLTVDSSRPAGLRVSRSGRFANNVIQMAQAWDVASKNKLDFVQMFDSELFDFSREVATSGPLLLPQSAEVEDDQLIVEGDFYFHDRIAGVVPQSAGQNVKLGEIAREHLAPYLDLPEVENPVSDDELLIHVRSGDLFGQKPHPSYGQPPLAFYIEAVKRAAAAGMQRVRVVAEDRLSPVIGALESYLREHGVPHIMQIGCSLGQDMATLLAARALVFGRGTFGRAVCMLSDQVSMVFESSASSAYRDLFPSLELLVSAKIERSAYGPFDRWDGSDLQRAEMLDFPATGITFDVYRRGVLVDDE